MITTDSQICPYTGLRSFTEDESLYFKGRDLQVRQIIALLEQNRFLMVTGASGEGKSSVVFAGLIPNARAGFFKAKYNNWVVADFRPERKPLRQMAGALGQQFGAAPDTIETELKRGFSSLVDLYTNSEFYINEEEDSWTQLDEAAKKNKRRGAANLMILVDQFEEFFTNPENFFNETPSQESQIVINLLLETSRIALKRGLPIYVVCTMRSDFIGQCSAFRGLAEYIGFSQFFVPRLKRKDLKQVIEEPSILSGNTISQRLIERLLYDLSEGVDQLPILQHALSQIWLKADRGNVEMDLIHYAMVGGISRDELPEEDQDQFDQWFTGLEPFMQKLYAETGLNKVIEIHADVLYESAFDHFKKNNPSTSLSGREVKHILAMSFACLTKVDQSRAVRNRMSLQEITDIINRPESNKEVLDELLGRFREEGNSFLRPYKTEDPESHQLKADTVLDITHESLIRSWDRLHKWVDQEFEFYTNYLDLKKQLDRWKKSGKSKDYLLPIGPLSFFENWYEKCQPNEAWLDRYSRDDEDEQRKDSKTILQDINEFLKLSARRVAISRAFMKYGSQRIVAGFAFIIVLFLSAFYWVDAQQKRDENIIKQVRSDASSLLNSEFVGVFTKGFHLIIEERYEEGSMMRLLSSKDQNKTRLLNALNTHFVLSVSDKQFDEPIKEELIEFINNDFEQLATQLDDPEFFLSQRVQYCLQLIFDNYYTPSEYLEVSITEQSNLLYESLTTYFGNTELYKTTVASRLNQALQLWLAFGDTDEAKIKTLLQMISPFENEASANLFDIYYPEGSYVGNGVRPLDNNGGYHDLASLYAALGNTPMVLTCLEKLGERPDYFSSSVFNNFSNILGFYYQFGYQDRVPELVDWIVQHSDRTEESIYNELILRSGYLSHFYRVNFNFTGATTEGNYYLNLTLADREMVRLMNEDYERLVNRLPDSNQRNYLTAIHKKRVPLFESKYNFDRGFPFTPEKWEEDFSAAIMAFNKVDKAYLEEITALEYPYLGGSRLAEWPRKHFFTYPDFIGSPLTMTFHSDIFYKYLQEQGHLAQLYNSEGDLDKIHFWLSYGFEVRPFPQFNIWLYNYPLANDLLVDILNFTSTNNREGFDPNLINIVLSNRYFEQGDTTSGLKQYEKVDFSTYETWGNKHEDFQRSFLINQLRFLASHLAANGLHEESIAICENFNQAEATILAYTNASIIAGEAGEAVSSLILLDSAYTKSRGVNTTQISGFRDFREDLIYKLSRMGGEEMKQLANKILKEMSEADKFNGIIHLVDGNVQAGNLYQALNSIPSTVTEDQELILKSSILRYVEADPASGLKYEKALTPFFEWNYNWFGSGSLN